MSDEQDMGQQVVFHQGTTPQWQNGLPGQVQHECPWNLQLPRAQKASSFICCFHYGH